MTLTVPTAIHQVMPKLVLERKPVAYQDDCKNLSENSTRARTDQIEFLFAGAHGMLVVFVHFLPVRK